MQFALRCLQKFYPFYFLQNETCGLQLWGTLLNLANGFGNMVVVN